MNRKTINFSGFGFILSGIGAAVGLGNIWRFPEQMVNGGGSSFIIVYLLVLLLIAFPIFLLEVNYGVFFKKGVVGCFGKGNRLIGRAAGWKQIMLVSFMGVYYLLIISWVGIGFVLSIVPSFFKDWGSVDNIGWFDKNILMKDDTVNTIKDISFAPWVIVGIVVILFITIVIIGAGIKNGVEKANYVFVPSLFLMLIGLTVYVTFFGQDSTAGIKALFSFEFSKMGDPYIWFSATKQAIFSTGVLFGILIVYAKYSDVRMDKGNEVILIIFADTFIALVAGLLVVGLVGNDIGKTPGISELKGQERTDRIVKEIKDKFVNSSSNLGGSGLLLSYLPVLFLPMNNGNAFGLGNVMMIVFTLTLLFAALSSMISLMEVFVDGIQENFKIKKRYAILTWIFFAILPLTLYSTTIGPKLLGRQDNIVLLGIIVIGVVETIILSSSSEYDRVTQKNDHYTFLKLRRFNWLKVMMYTITIPILILLALFGILQISGLNHIFASEKYDKFFGWLKLNTDKSKPFDFDLTQIISFAMFGGSIFLTSWLWVLSKKINQIKIDPKIQ